VWASISRSSAACGGAVDIDAAAVHFLEPTPDARFARGHGRAVRVSPTAAPPPAAHRLEPRHFEHVERLHQPVDIDGGASPARRT